MGCCPGKASKKSKQKNKMPVPKKELILRREKSLKKDIPHMLLTIYPLRISLKETVDSEESLFYRIKQTDKESILSRKPLFKGELSEREKEERKISIDFDFSSEGIIEFEIITSEAELNVLGKAEFFLSELIQAENHRKIFNIEIPARESGIGEVELMCSLNQESIDEIYNIQIAASNFNVNSKIGFTISNALQDRQPDLLYHSDIITVVEGQETLWNPLFFNKNTLLPSQQIILHLITHDGNDEKIGPQQTFLIQDLLSKETNEWKIENHGCLIFRRFTLDRRFTILEFLMAQMKIDSTISIDFTLSNKHFAEEDSRHNISEQNPYSRCIQTLGTGLETYDPEMLHAVYGYGGILQIPGLNCPISHCFALNGNIHNPFILGIDNIIAKYRFAVPKIQFSGPSYFNHILSNVNERVADYYGKNFKIAQKYFIHLILTDGGILDLAQTQTELVKSSELPLSIIIIGIGRDDFSSWEKIMKDPSPIYSRQLKKSAKRFSRKCFQFYLLNNYEEAIESLKKDVFQFISNQLHEFMMTSQVKPLKSEENKEIDLRYPYFEEKKRLLKEDLLKQELNAEKVNEILENGFPHTNFKLLEKILKEDFPYVNSLNQL